VDTLSVRTALSDPFPSCQLSHSSLTGCPSPLSLSLSVWRACSMDRALFLLTSHVMAGVIHVQITLSHFAMPITTLTAATAAATAAAVVAGAADSGADADADADSGGDSADRMAAAVTRDTFVERQIAGTLNVSCSPSADWFHGGLQFQCEHHLIPRMPRHRLRAFSRDVLKPFAERHALRLAAEPFVECNRMVMRTLRDAADAARALRDGTCSADDLSAGAEADKSVAEFTGRFGHLLNADG
jgi:hypothetical protein